MNLPSDETSVISHEAVVSTAHAVSAKSRNFGMLLLMAGAVCFGLNIPIAGLATRQGVSGSESVFIRIVLMLIIMSLYCWKSGISLSIAAKSRFAVFSLGVVSALVSIAYVSSIAFIPVGVAAMVFYTFPIVILLTSPFIDKAKLTALMLIAAALTFCGIALVIGPSFAMLDWRGVALAAAASLAAASQFFIGARAPGGGGFAMIFWLQVIMLPFAFVSTLVFANAPFTHLDAGWLAVLLSAAGAIVGIFCQYAGLARVGATLASLIFCLEPIVSTLFSAWLLGEVLKPLQYAGGALVVCGICLSCLVPHPKVAS